MAQTRKEKKREATRAEIIAAAWKQVGEYGAAALSLRAIAGKMGLTAPALYRYYKDRNALVSALLIDAFNFLADALEARRDSCAVDDYSGRIRSVGKAYFHWGCENPQKYALLFGTPIPGYEFAEEVGPAAQRSFLILQGVIGAAYAAGKITGEAVAFRLPASLKLQYEVLKKYGLPYPPIVTQLSLSAWASIHGMTSLYLYGYMSGFLGDQVDAFVDLEAERLIHNFGL